MDKAFQFMLNATDPVLGDPNDGHCLVQRWVWCSLAEQVRITKLGAAASDGFKVELD
jgi:hypothetical protein